MFLAEMPSSPSRPPSTGLARSPYRIWNAFLWSELPTQCSAHCLEQIRIRRSSGMKIPRYRLAMTQQRQYDISQVLPFAAKDCHVRLFCAAAVGVPLVDTRS